MKLLVATITSFLSLGQAHAQNPTLQTLNAAFEAAEAEKNHAVVVSRPSLPHELNLYSPQAAEFLFHYGIIPSSDDDKLLFENAAEWWGVKYRWGGLSKTGVDCQGLVRNVVHSTYGITLPAGAGSQYRMCTPVRNKAELQPGDLVFFRIGGGYISHVGLYLKNNKFVHATTCCGVVVSDLDEYYYRLWYFSGGRLPFDIAERRPEPAVCPPVLSPFVPENEPESIPVIEACRESFPWEWGLTLPFLNR
jgi:lipoprotein Spr